MKRIICLTLAALLLCCFCGCHYSDSGDILEPVEFFYPRQNASYVYGAEDGVLASEIREASGHADDLNYLLSMYLRGPQDPGLRSPFPAGCRLEEVRIDSDTVCVVLTAEFAALENVELTLACASLAKTCLALTDAQQVRIDAASPEKNISITLDADSLLLADYSAFEAQPVTEEP